MHTQLDFREDCVVNLKLLVKRILCAVMALVLLLSVAGCGKDSGGGKKKVIKKKVIKVIKEEEDESILEDSAEEEEEEERARRELWEEKDETYVPEYTVQNVAWSGPEGYVIDYPAGDKREYVNAKYLRAFFKKHDGVELPIVTDATASADKEILVGNTNRYKTSLKEKEYKVSLVGNKLIFEGGHFATIEKATRWFMAIPRVAGQVATLKGEAEDLFTSVKWEGETYNYVWGYEADGDFLDKTKVIEQIVMNETGGKHVALKDDKRSNRVEEGLLKMSSMRYFSETNSNQEYQYSHDICSGETMWWVHGYLEMRAKVPCGRGSWAGWWTKSLCLSDIEPSDITKMQDTNCMVEVDIFETFGIYEFVPNLHRWYRQGYKRYPVEWSSDSRFTLAPDFNPGRFWRFDYVYGLDGKPVLRENSYDGYEFQVSYGGGKVEVPNSITKRYKVDTNAEDEYHIFGYRWDEDKMVMSVDGDEYMTFDLNWNYAEDWCTNSMDPLKFNPQHFIFTNTLYYDGSWNGTAANAVNLDDLPKEYFVDYIRLYQKDGQKLDNIGLDKEIEYK